MTVAAQQGGQGIQAQDARKARAKRLRGRNYAVLGALLALAALFYAITVVRMGIGH